MTMLSSANGNARPSGSSSGETSTGSGYLPRDGGNLDDNIPFAPQVV
jgi:hypothetical protein